MKRLTVTIGIPAHNEQACIGQLLSALRAQQEERICIEKIVVVTDGCIDNTVKIVHRHMRQDIRIVCIEKTEREGKIAGINSILSRVQSDIVVFMDADVSISRSTHIEQLCVPFIEDETVGITAAHAVPEPAETYIESAISSYHFGLSYVYRWYRNGDIIYSASGCSVALRRKWLPESMPQTQFDDAYWYLWMKKQQKKYVFLHDLPVYFRNPQTIHDVLVQQSRYANTVPEMRRIFSASLIHDAYHIPWIYRLFITCYSIVTNPIGYAVLKIQLALRMLSTMRNAKKTQFWAVVTTTKKVTNRTLQ